MIYLLKIRRDEVVKMATLMRRRLMMILFVLVTTSSDVWDREEAESEEWGPLGR